MKIAFLGDSITAGYGLHHQHSYPSLLGDILKNFGVSVEIVNAGVSGDTTADGARRIAVVLGQPDKLAERSGKKSGVVPEFVVVALGANDMIRGVPLLQVRKNLSKIIESIQVANSRCLLLGMNAGPFHGLDYIVGFNSIFSDLANQYSIPVLPFFIEEIALQAEYNQADGIHPNSAGQRKIAERVAKFLLPHLNGEEGSHRSTRSDQPL